MQQENVYYSTGRRKTAISRTWLTPGSGQITINNLPVEKYFPIETIRTDMIQPFKITNTVGSYDIKATVVGGGIAGQAGAVRHGITRALVLVNPDFRLALKRAGFIKRDPRVKERKKYGQKGARALFQFSKR
ncbi:MAG: 30S ribosomal protein S9 [bacterium]|nr:30S ribosomal protein S9 [bacterium]